MPFQSRSLAYLQEKVLTTTWLLGGLCEMTWWSLFIPLWADPCVITGHRDGRGKGLRAGFRCYRPVLAMAGEAPRVCLAATFTTSAIGWSLSLHVASPVEFLHGEVNY